MNDYFLKTAKQIGVISEATSTSYQAFLKEIRELPGVSVPIHGLELHNILKQPGVCKTEPDFALLIEAQKENAAKSVHPLVSLLEVLEPILGCSAIWVEFDAEQWNPPSPHPKGLPLIYVSPKVNISPVIFLHKYLEELLKTLRHWLANQDWNGDSIPEERAIGEWLTELPENSLIQQFGLSFRGGKVQPRLLLELPNRGATRQLLKKIGAPGQLQEPSLEAQMLIAVAYPYQPQQMMGLEILADRCSLSNLRKLRHPPRLRGSRLEKVMNSLSGTDQKKEYSNYTAQLSGLEGRFSQLQSNTLKLRLWGVNHLKLMLQAGKLIQLKAYIGEVDNSFKTIDTSGPAM